jgi:hypothetical protein
MVMAILIAIMGGLSIVTTPTDIFPYINIPMVGVIWTYRVRALGGVYANPAGYHDGAGDDHRYASDGICPRRRG